MTDTAHPATAPPAPVNTTLDIVDIFRILPHRFPFLLIDRVIEIQRKQRIVAIKNVTINEPFFAGHFPNLPIMPGVLIVEAIAQADLITIGPGSLFTSLIPNLLVRGIPEAIRESSAVKVYVCNLMTQANESLGRTAADHIRALNDHAHCQLFDYALVNRASLSSELKAKYALEGASQIVADLDTIEAMGVCPVLGDYLFEDNVARHDTERVASDLMELVMTAPAAEKHHAP